MCTNPSLRFVVDIWASMGYYLTPPLLHTEIGGKSTTLPVDSDEQKHRLL